MPPLPATRRRVRGFSGLSVPILEIEAMFRTFFAAVVALILVAGGLFAEDIKAVFKKFEDGKATVEVDGKIVEYKVSPDAKIKKKNGDEILLTDVFKKLKEGLKGTMTVEDGVITKVVPEKKAKP
jgi:hypothetical protein